MSKLIFVTGVSGFLGAHVAQQLLEAGYRVRAAVRSSKVASVKDGFAYWGNTFEVAVVEDIVYSEMTEALKGVHAIVHVAAPLGGKGGPEFMISGAVDGTLNVLKQGYATGIRKFVVTSSIVSVFDPVHLDRTEPYTDKDWNPATLAQALAPGTDPLFVYCVAKTIAEREVWKFSDEKGDVDITAINPPFLFGPFAPSFYCPVPDRNALSTNFYIAQILNKEKGVLPSIPGWVDVRDAARAHVLALQTDTAPTVPHKRILIGGEWVDYGEVVRYLVQVRPELKDRIVDPSKATKTVEGWMIDMSRAKQLFGLDRSDLRTWKETFPATSDSLLKLEKEWAEKGLKLEI